MGEQIGQTADVLTLGGVQGCSSNTTMFIVIVCQHSVSSSEIGAWGTRAFTRDDLQFPRKQS